ncbi:MAG: ABC transporter permease [Candidatus Aminicenantes bacterium]|nr:ABC transporter permease [Candidatus Aminicenantes bacterium]
MMTELLRLALRNAFRYRRRTVLTCLAIAFGLGLTIVGMALFKGVEKTSLDHIKNSETAHFLVYPNRRAGRLISTPTVLATRLRALPGVAGVACRLRCAATLINGQDELPVTAIGIEAEHDPSVFRIAASLRTGKFLAADEGDTLLVGSGLASDLNLAAGDPCSLRLFAVGDEANWNAIDLQVKGVFVSGNPRLDRGADFLPLPLLQESLGVGDRVGEIALRMQNEKDLDKAKSAIASVLKESGFQGKVLGFWEAASGLIEVNRLRSRLHAIVPLIMLLVAALGIINTMLMAVMERTREIGLLRAMGFRKREVLLLFVLEGGVIGFLGSAASCLIGGLCGWYLQTHGIDIAFLLGREVADIAAAIYPIQDVFRADLTFGMLAFALVFGTVVSVVCSFYPAWRAVRLDPVSALRRP